MKWLSEKLSPAHPRVTEEHAHLHEHDSHVHFHWHSHAPAEDHHGDSPTPPRWFASNERTQPPSAIARLGLCHVLRPLFVGIVHGLAGSAAVALLVLSTIHDTRWSVLYLLVFGVGTIGGMMLITTALALPFSFAGHKFAWLNRSFVIGSGLLSLVFGLFVCYQVGFAGGLFTSHPHWTPS
jgi:high-affinity nickel-transport protein